MPNYPPHALLQLGGHLDFDGPADKREIWSCGLRMFGNDSDTPHFVDDPENVLDEIMPDLKTWWEDRLNFCRSDASLEYLKLNNINAGGLYNEGITHERHFTAIPGGGDAFIMPAFLSLSWSFTTGISRGLAHRGRVYFPNVFNWEGGSSVTDASRDAHATAAFNFLGAAQGNLPETEGTTPAVVSGVRGGAGHPITGVAVGNIIDVQRRRKNAGAETYKVLAY